MIRRSSFVAALAIFASATQAQAQQAGPTDQGGGAGNGTQTFNNPPAGAQGTQGTQGGGMSGSTTNTSIYGVVAPPPPGQPVGGGNATESSSRPVTGDREDGFDLAPGGGGGGTVYGNTNNGGVFFDSQNVARVAGPPPSTHTVKKGDTLWGICDEYFKNPYQWPRIWSYNAQIQNPHWIYPNEQVRLKPNVPLGPQVAMPEEGDGRGMSLMRNGVPPETIFLRDQGFVNDDESLNWGSIVGSPLDKMFMTDLDEVYVRVGPGHDVKLGEELTIFRPVRAVSDGQVISIQGTVRVDQWNPQTRIARAQMVETLDAVERGARVGPITRRFQVVQPRRNDVDATVHIAVAVHPHVIYGDNQIVFVDHGADVGLQPGNRLFIVRHGDSWRQSLSSDQTARRIQSERQEPAVVENTPKLRDDSALPEEIVGELRVLAVQKKSATCMLTASKKEIEPNDVAVARKGY